MPLIVKPSAFTCRAERLARAGTGPYGPSAPACKLEGVGPTAETCEEMALGESGEFVGSHILDTPSVHDAGRDVAGVDQVAQPLGGVGVDFVVVNGHGSILPRVHPHHAPGAGGAGHAAVQVVGLAREMPAAPEIAQVRADAARVTLQF